MFKIVTKVSSKNTLKLHYLTCRRLVRCHLKCLICIAI